MLFRSSLWDSELEVRSVPQHQEGVKRVNLAGPDKQVLYGAVRSVLLASESEGRPDLRVAMIVAIASEIAQQRIASPADIDSAVRLGLGYPVGPLSMGDLVGPGIVNQLLKEIAEVTGDPRYRPSPWLRRRASLGLSLLHPE